MKKRHSISLRLYNYIKSPTMKIIKKLEISKPIDEVWEVLGNQFGEIDRWASLISHSTLSGDSTLKGISYAVRSTETTGGPTKQEMTSFNAEQHSLSYKAISGTPAFFKSVTAAWSLSKTSQSSTALVLDFEVKFKGISAILSPLVKLKLGKVGHGLLEEFKYYVEKGTPHPRKAAQSSKTA
jgi:hypothetical protein